MVFEKLIMETNTERRKEIRDCNKFQVEYRNPRLQNIYSYLVDSSF